MENDIELFGAGNSVIILIGGLQITLPCSLSELEGMCIMEQQMQNASKSRVTVKEPLPY